MTILLSLTIFLNTVSEIIPITSDSPLIGTYFNCIMFMVASSVVTTIMILNYHHRRPDTHHMPDWVRAGRKISRLDSVKISAGAPDLPELAAVAAVHVAAPPPALSQDAAHEEEAEGGRRAQVDTI